MRTHVTNLLALGPNQTTALLSDPEVETLAETLVAFANADGGTILVGITPEGEVTGDVLGEDVEAVLSRSLGLCRPPVATEWGQEDLPQGTAWPMAGSSSAMARKTDHWAAMLYVNWLLPSPAVTLRLSQSAELLAPTWTTTSWRSILRSGLNGGGGPSAARWMIT
jgi:hypothetical protein